MAILKAIDLNDVYFWTGLCGLWVGCRALHAPAAPIVCGAVLLCVGLWGASRGTN